MSNAVQSISAPGLAELEPGKLSVKAPVSDGAIQCNLFGKKIDFCTLNLDIDLEEIKISREDGKDLQIQVRSATIGGKPSTVLREPVDEITLSTSDRRCWAVGPEDLEVDYMTGFQIFADLLAQHGVAKQARS